MNLIMLTNSVKKEHFSLQILLFIPLAIPLTVLQCKAGFFYNDSSMDVVPETKNQLLTLIIVFVACTLPLRAEDRIQTVKLPIKSVIVSSEVHNHYTICTERMDMMFQSIDRMNFRPSTAESLKKILIQGRKGYVPPGLTVEQLMMGGICVKALMDMFWAVFGTEETSDAGPRIYVNAWEMENHLLSSSGEIIWTKRENSRAANRGDDFAKYSRLVEIGDILGLHYGLSVYNTDVEHQTKGIQPNPVGYTHVALVIAIDPVDGPIVAHHYRLPNEMKGDSAVQPWPLRIEPVNKMLDIFMGLFEVRAIMRPLRFSTTRPS